MATAPERLKKPDGEPACKLGFEHSWQHLGEEDSGETVERCGNCLALRYKGKDGAITGYEAYHQVAGKRALRRRAEPS